MAGVKRNLQKRNRRSTPDPVEVRRRLFRRISELCKEAEREFHELRRKE